MPAENRDTEWKLVRHDGKRSPFNITHPKALSFATDAAEAFGVEQPNQPADFDADLANKVQALGKDARKALLRQGPVTKEAVERFATKPQGDNLETSLRRKNKPELEADCMERGLSTQGKKDDLVKRLLESYQGHESEAGEEREGDERDESENGGTSA